MHRHQQKIPILMYHSIADDAHPRFKPFAVAPHRFAEHMAYLATHGYTPITVTRYAEILADGGSGLPERPVMLTFDDGFADFHSAALPVLIQHGFVATLYIPTAFVGGASRWLWREGEATRRMLTWSQIDDIQASGIECGGHTHEHVQLDILPADVARREIVKCKQILEARLGQPITSFAYPFGYYNLTARRLVQEAGYLAACSVRYTLSSLTDDRFALARLIVAGDMRQEDFAGLLAGRRSRMKPLIHRARAPVWQFVRRVLAHVKYMQLGAV